MTQTILVRVAENMTDIPNWFAVCMGIGTVFVGLICIIIICSIMGLFFRGKESETTAQSNPHLETPAVMENRQEILAAVCAAAAEDMGTDISALKVISFKKI